MVEAMNILIAIPTTSQSLKSATAISVTNVVKFLISAGHQVDLHNIDSAEVVTARDMFANMVLHSDHWDHLLFIDSDMVFDPSVVARLIAEDAQIRGVAYTRRSLDIQRLVNASRKGADLNVALALASSFTFKPDWEDDSAKSIDVSAGFCDAAAVGMGCTLVAKNALQLMIEGGTVSKRYDLQTGDGKECWSFFDNLDHMGVRLGEDYSFCYRWTKILGQRLRVGIDMPIGHFGGFEYTARFIDTLSLV